MRNFSLISMICSIFYLVAGVGILLFQDSLKPLFMGSNNYVTVYPLDALVHLAFVGLPCAVLSAVNLAGSHSDKTFLPLATSVYCGIILGLQSVGTLLLSTANNIVISQMGGVEYLANLSVVNQMFAWIRVFSNVALVLLLIAGVIESCSRKNEMPR